MVKGSSPVSDGSGAFAFTHGPSSATASAGATVAADAATTASFADLAAAAAALAVCTFRASYWSDASL